MKSDVSAIIGLILYKMHTMHAKYEVSVSTPHHEIIKSVRPSVLICYLSALHTKLFRFSRCLSLFQVMFLKVLTLYSISACQLQFSYSLEKIAVMAN